MSLEDNILNLFDEYFQSASKEEIKKDIAYINSIGLNGVSIEEYLDILNLATAYSLKENGICDDIAFADMFNNSIRPIQMGEINDIKLGEAPIPIKYCDLINIPDFAENYSLAA